MLDHLHTSARVLQRNPPASQQELDSLRKRFPSIPEEYIALMRKASELEFSIRGHYLRVWGPCGCVDMDEGYDISRRIPGAMPIGDNGGCMVMFYWNGPRGPGVYSASYGDLDPTDANWVAPTLESMLCEGEGVEAFGECDA